MRKLTSLFLLLINIPLFAQQNLPLVFESNWQEDVDRIWIGENYWANRLQDWQLKIGRLECTVTDPNMVMRTVHVITAQLVESNEDFAISVRTGLLHWTHRAEGTSWSGFLIGAGRSELDYKGASLVHHFSGTNGGIICALGETGRPVFRSNEPMETRDEYPLLENIEWDQKKAGRGNYEDYELKLSGHYQSDGTYTLSLEIFDFVQKQTISKAHVAGIPENQLRGNIALISHGGKTDSPNRYWFRDLKMYGGKIKYSPEHEFGPILNALYSVNRSIFKITAQFPVLGFSDSRSVELYLRKSGEKNWEQPQTSEIIIPSHTAHFRSENRNPAFDYEFKLEYQNHGKKYERTGFIPHDPIEKETIKMAGFCCVQAMGRPADDSWGANRFGDDIGRWKRANVWFPQEEVYTDVAQQKPDLLAFLGDQIYEGGSPTNPDFMGRNPALDYFYKYYLWCWSVQDLTNKIPSICMVDDHDVYQGDLWGADGKRTLYGNNKDGGYVLEPAFVRLVEATQTSHNPDPANTKPLEQGISSCYGAFNLGGVSWAFLEDRKHKSLPTIVKDVKKSGSKIVTPNYDPKDADIPGAKILGDDQIEFLENWVHDYAGAELKIALLQTLFASLHTDPEHQKWIDLDSNGWPQSARNRALRVFRKGHVFLVGGDTHLASVVHHGVDEWRDASVQFIVPAVANKYRRWWNPAEGGKNRKAGAAEYTGDNTDGLGNLVTVLASGNPLIPTAEVERRNKEHGGSNDPQLMIVRDLVKDGYGLFLINKRQEVTMESVWCNKSTPEKQEIMPDWPVTVKVEDNYARKAVEWLPELNFKGIERPVVQITNEKTGDKIYTIRAREKSFKPKVFENGIYSIWIGEPGTGRFKVLQGIESSRNQNEKIEVKF